MKDELQIIVKTFERAFALTRLLDSIHELYPSLTIWIADDSREHFKARRATERVLKLPFDVGKLCARQVALSHVTTPYVLMLDDDFVFEAKTNLEQLLQIAKESGALFTGGDVEDYGSGRGRRMFGNLVYYPEFSLGTEAVQESAKALWVECEFIADFYVANVAMLRQLGGYDCRLKIGGSFDVFLRAKLANMKLAFVPSVAIGHWPESSKSYETYRFRCTERLSQFWKPIAETEWKLKHFPP